MENLSEHTSIELLKLINDTKKEHDMLKKEIITHTQEVDELEEKINDLLEILTEVEKKYVMLIEEINSRE